MIVAITARFHYQLGEGLVFIQLTVAKLFAQLNIWVGLVPAVAIFLSVEHSHFLCPAGTLSVKIVNDGPCLAMWAVIFCLPIMRNCTVVLGRSLLKGYFFRVSVCIFGTLDSANLVERHTFLRGRLLFYTLGDRSTSYVLLMVSSCKNQFCNDVRGFSLNQGAPFLMQGFQFHTT